MKLSNADITKLVPEFMRNDAAVRGLATAVNKLIREPGAKVKTARVWDQIDELDDAQLDELAYELDVDWYDSSLPTETKRAIIKISDLVHSRRGTKWAVEELISAHFSANGFVMEWHEEGYINPRPFHFTVYTNSRNVNDSMLNEFIEVARVAMSVRSRADGVYFSDNYGARLNVGSSDAAFFFTSKKCGTIPRNAVVGKTITGDAAVITNETGAGRVILAKCGATKCGN